MVILTGAFFKMILQNEIPFTKNKKMNGTIRLGIVGVSTAVGTLNGLYQGCYDYAVKKSDDLEPVFFHTSSGYLKGAGVGFVLALPESWPFIAFGLYHGSKERKKK
jgi:hypothetical protein